MKQSDPVRPALCAEKLGALAAPERIKIIRFLAAGPHNVTEIAEMLRTAPVNVAHHMSVLRQAGIVRSRKRGRFVYYSLVPGFHHTEQSSRKEFLDLGCCRLEMPRPDKRRGSTGNRPLHTK
jgi:DNA-binding transcriptional ArsR family regulator